VKEAFEEAMNNSTLFGRHTHSANLHGEERFERAIEL
jgi:hypothetical protein